MFDGYIHYTWSFSIAMLVITRGYPLLGDVSSLKNHRPKSEPGSVVSHKRKIVGSSSHLGRWFGIPSVWWVASQDSLSLQWIFRSFQWSFSILSPSRTRVTRARPSRASHYRHRHKTDRSKGTGWSWSNAGHGLRTADPKDPAACSKKSAHHVLHRHMAQGGPMGKWWE